MSLPALQPTYAPFAFEMASASGDVIQDTEGRAWLDFYGGHCVASTGHCHPAVVEAIQAQAGKLLFYSTAGKLGIREQAAEALVSFATGMASVFFCNTGAEANESALKLALQLTGRKRLAAVQGGWHGRSLLALSVTDDAPLHQGLESVLHHARMLPFGDQAALETVDFSELAAVILEPIQSMAGCRVHPLGWLRKLREKCTASGTLLIFDEVQTGFGRLGHPFAFHAFGVRPDLVTCAKGIASGVPMGALLMSESVAGQVKTGMLGSTFGGGPLACAALLATLKVIADEQLCQRAGALEMKVRTGLQGSVVQAVTGQGLLLGLQAGAAAKALKDHLFERRILVGSSHDPATLRLMPPLTLSDASVEAFLEAVHAFSPLAVGV
ncbi:MAG TPA: aspartate aminotransferase family protein [Holophagaceae bacterium]|nr:aspartate aminotransferase family protein [Holophagaceae bacterium]